MICLILSGTYVGEELANEFGKIPPSYLPVGNKKIITNQIAELNKIGISDIYLTLPESFKNQVGNLNVNGIFVDDDLSLIESLKEGLKSINHMINDDTEILILYGDGLYFLDDIVNEINNDNLVGYSNFLNPNSYGWGLITDDEKGLRILNENYEITQKNQKVFSGFIKFDSLFNIVETLNDVTNIFEGLNKLFSFYSFKTVKNKWLDFGHLNTYFRSKTKFTTERSFNTITFKKGFFKKSSDNSQKIRAEYEWFKKAKTIIPINIPRCYTEGNENSLDSYFIEYLYSPTLSEMFVFGKLTKYKWRYIIKAIFDTISEFHFSKVDNKEDGSATREVFNALYKYKCEKRISKIPEDLLKEAGLEFNEMELIIEDVLNFMEEEYTFKMCNMHGDFCFSNILWDNKLQRPYFIDPRGAYGVDYKEINTIGDIGYDLSKFMHSSYGFYDHIVTKKVTTIEALEKLDKEYKDFNDLCFDYIKEKFNYTKKEIVSILVLLFFSMIPLHTEDRKRQILFLENAVRLYNKFKAL